eukprot:scaffold266248_cov47-Prasinocladus_malaysianus.AAC.1
MSLRQGKRLTLSSSESREKMVKTFKRSFSCEPSVKERRSITIQEPSEDDTETRPASKSPLASKGRSSADYENDAPSTSSGGGMFTSTDRHIAEIIFKGNDSKPPEMAI